MKGKNSPCYEYDPNLKKIYEPVFLTEEKNKHSQLIVEKNTKP